MHMRGVWVPRTCVLGYGDAALRAQDGAVVGLGETRTLTREGTGEVFGHPGLASWAREMPPFGLNGYDPVLTHLGSGWAIVRGGVRGFGRFGRLKNGV